MLHLKSFTFNDFQENTYILFNDKKQCWIIDPGMYYPKETKQFIAFITENGLQPQSIINTHTHLDHIFGVQTLIDKYQLPFGIHKDEMQVLNYAETSAAIFGIKFNNVPKPTFFIEEGVPIMLGEDKLEVFHCPGHSTGSIVFYNAEENFAVSGDVLFAGSIGRTDLPGGNFETLIASIHHKLFLLPGNTVIYSGHGVPTTIAEEKLYNPFCKMH